MHAQMVWWTSSVNASARPTISASGVILVRAYPCRHICMYVCVCVCVCVCVYIYMRVCTLVGMYVCMYVCVCVPLSACIAYTYTHKYKIMLAYTRTHGIRILPQQPDAVREGGEETS